MCLTLKAEQGIVLTHPFTSYKTEVKDSGSHYVVTIPDVYRCVDKISSIADRLNVKFVTYINQA